MEKTLLTVSVIGRKINPNDESCESFHYILDKYEKLLIWEHFDKLLELNRATGFFLTKSEVNDEEYLTLCYSEEYAKKTKISNQIKSQKEFVVSSFFEPIEQHHECEDVLTLDNFYERLKESHLNDDFNSVPQNVQHPALKSSTRLRPYQVRSIKWMLKRELEVENLPSDFIKMQSKANQDHIMYYNRTTCEFTMEKPKELTYPSGGLLCDEMGLGKTVEMITLILMNPKPQSTVLSGNKRKIEEIDIDDIPLKKLKALTSPKKSMVKCICHKEKRSRRKQDSFIMCSNCHLIQHKKCVREEIGDVNYMCPFCWKTSNRVVESSSTIIVSPTSIKQQWHSEIQRHVANESFKVLVYEGISNGWISPEELATYDIIITDFSTLSRELYFAETIDRQLRQSKKFEYPPSPLIHVKFWRVVCDEAQMVENANARPSQMVQTLPSIHRWGCTGTPIERGSIQNLYGLIYFLGVYPYTDFKAFNNLWINYRNGKPLELIKFLSKIMWRTCKKDVEHEIDIPPQEEIIHYVQMSDLQECFYRQVHETTKPRFLKYIFNYISYFDNKKKERITNYDLMDKPLYELDNATLRSLLEPLRNLRQDCTIANLFSNANDQTRTKQTLHADQLHEHLVKKTTIECKSALRTICSSLNGIAALKIAEEKYDEARDLYQQVLRLAKDYNAVNGVHVDSMLQIHSYNGLLEMAELTQNEEELAMKENYSSEMMKLEWKYIRNYYDKVQDINKEIEEIRNDFKQSARNYHDRDGNWWRNIISESRTHSEESRLVELINTEFLSGILTGSGSAFAEHTRSTHGIQLILTEWTDKLEQYSKEIKKRFKNFDYIICDLRPSNEMNSQTNEKINHLAKTALECHLNLLEDKNEFELEQRPRNAAKKLCDLCKLKTKLDEYECVLFNKTLVDDVVEGTWNPRLEERLLKVVFNFAKRTNFDEEEIEMGKHFFKYLEMLKKQYKILAQLWVEVNYTIAAYDEINMCKIRMQVVDSLDEISEEDARIRLKITRHEIDDQIDIFKGQKLEAEMQFTRLNGRLKYLDHLLKENEIPTCPICTNQAKDRYYVTVCGHSVCAECFITLTKEKRRFSNYERLKINCPVCRTNQEIGNILAVTCKDSKASDETIVGSYSPKIDEIIRCILRLRSNEPNVKILIFSQWDSILAAIVRGLKENQISFRTSFTGNFGKQIEEFKDSTKGVTCLMVTLKCAGKGLNLTEANHIFLVEPILNADEELQAIGRIHRIGQTQNTFVHKFITQGTIEETLYDKIMQEKEKWIHKKFTLRDLESLFMGTNRDDSNDFLRLI